MTIKMIITQLKAAALNTFVKKSVISLKANIGKCGDFGREEWYARRGGEPTTSGFGAISNPFDLEFRDLISPL